MEMVIKILGGIIVFDIIWVCLLIRAAKLRGEL